MAIKVKLKNGVFEPLESIDKIEKKYQNKEIRIEILPEIEEMKETLRRSKLAWRGSLKHLKITSVELQHKIKDLW